MRSPKFAPGGRLALGVVWLLAAVVTGAAVLHAAGSVHYLGYLAARGEVVDMWAFLSALDVTVALIALAMGWMCLSRQKLRRAAAFLILPLIAPVVIEASRCDVEAVCRTIGWAALPHPAFDWSVRIRDVNARS